MGDDSVSVVIPTWNQAPLVRNVLETLKRQSVTPAEIIVVDNGSSDGTLALAEHYGAKAIPLGSNQGFARAVNAGIEGAQSEWIFVLNNDVELDGQWLEHALRAAAEERSLFVGGKLLQSKRPERIDGTWDLVAASGCAWRCGWNAPDSELWNERKRVQILSFTAILIHRQVFQTVGLLDTSYGSYYEDVDFGLRCALAGFTGVYEPRARAMHQGSAALGGSAKTSYLVSRNQALLAAKFRLMKRSPIRVLAGQALFVLTRLRQGGFAAAVRGKWDGIRMARGRPAFAVDGAQLQTLISEQEKQIVQFQKQIGWDLSWKIYFSVPGLRQ